MKDSTLSDCCSLTNYAGGQAYQYDAWNTVCEVFGGNVLTAPCSNYTITAYAAP